jgi:hypothetical protein
MKICRPALENSVELGMAFLLAVVFGAGVLVSLLPVAIQDGGRLFFVLPECGLFLEAAGLE